MEPTATADEHTGTKAGEGRVPYSTAGRHARYAKHRAALLRLSSMERRVLDAVLAFTTDYSKLADHVYSHQLAAFVGLDPTNRSQRGRVGAALRVLSGHGVVLYRPGVGRSPSLVALPEPPDGWADPTAEAAPAGVGVTPRCRTQSHPPL